MIGKLIPFSFFLKGNFWLSLEEIITVSVQINLLSGKGNFSMETTKKSEFVFQLKKRTAVHMHYASITYIVLKQNSTFTDALQSGNAF